MAHGISRVVSPQQIGGNGVLITRKRPATHIGSPNAWHDAPQARKEGRVQQQLIPAESQASSPPLQQQQQQQQQLEHEQQEEQKQAGSPDALFCAVGCQAIMSPPERSSGLARALSASPARDELEVDVAESASPAPGESQQLNRILFEAEATDAGRDVRFLRCKHCQNVFVGSEEQRVEGGHRHLFCSGECYITRYALMRASLVRRSSSRGSSAANAAANAAA